MRGVAVAALAAAMTVAAPSAQANLGELDPSFGRGGIVRTNFGWGPLPSIARAVVQQADGKLVAGGTGYTEWPAFGLARWTVDGALDPSFGDGGRVVTDLGVNDFGSGDDGIHGLAQQPDGKLVAVGQTAGWSIGIQVLARYLADGRLDDSFGVGGIVRTEQPGEHLYGQALVLQPDGRIVVMATASADVARVRLTRYLADGALDETFGVDGVVTIDAGEYEDAASLALLPDGTFLVAGRQLTTSGTGVLLARVQPDGALDGTFGSGGIRVTPLSSGLGRVDSMHAFPDGRSLVAGVTGAGDTFVVRHRADGTPDPTFGSTGIVVTPSIGSRDDTAAQLVVQPDGRPVVAVTSYGLGSYAVRLRRYDLAGALDATFVSSPPASMPSQPRGEAALRQADGRIVVAGAWDPDLDEMLVVRWTGDGTPDAGFGAGGVVTASVASSWDRPEAALVQRDGKIVVVGATKGTLNDDVALARYELDGTLDPSFGVGGKVVTALDVRDDAAVAVVQQDDGKLVVGVYVDTIGLSRFRLVRYDASGAVDPSFGTNGIVETSIQGDAYVVGLLSQAGGKLVAIGTSRFGGHSRFALVRYLANGELDTGFGTGGVVVTPSTGGATRALHQRDGKIVVGGDNGNALVARYDADGVLDAGFGVGGKQTLPALTSLFGLVEQADGGIIAHDGFDVVRLTAEGTIEATFPSGVPMFQIASVQLRDGTLLIGGDAFVDPAVQFAVAHRFANGAPDASFGGNTGYPGMLVTQIGSSSGTIVAMVALPDGRVVAAGPSDSDFVLARYLTEPCGNGRVDPGEQCDAGVGGDLCCDATCRWADTRGVCNDGDPCTLDTCDVGVGCMHAPGPRTACHPARNAKLILTDDANDARDRLQWKSQVGDAVPIGELGVPTATTDYGLCVYTVDRAATLAMPAGSAWKRQGATTFTFSSADRVPHGVRKATVRSGAAGKASVAVDARGGALPDLPMPLELPVRVQLVNDTGTCIEAIYETATRNDGRRFRAERR